MTEVISLDRLDRAPTSRPLHPVSSPKDKPKRPHGPPHGAHKRKNPHPSRDMLPPDGHRYMCPWLADSLTIHSDGNVSCGLDDPHAQRSFGNLNNQSVAEVFANPEFKRLQNRLWEGRRCRGCNLYQMQPLDAPRPAPRPALPTTVVIETTVKCNLRCPNAACGPNNDPTMSTRDRDELPLSEFENILDQLAESVRQVYFFNYGEPFFNRDAADMLVHLRERCPNARIVTSTNAIPLSRRATADKVITSLDQITVTISGVRQTSYARYHEGGQLGQALLGLQNLCDAKSDLGLRTPIITWRYLLFRWNDTEAEIDAAIALSKIYGVDQFSLYLTSIPAGAASYRLAPGTRLFAKYRRYIDPAHGYSHPAVDSEGLFPGEHIEGLGRARWTSWQATLRRRRHGHWLRLSITTLRPDLAGVVRHCFVRTAWGAWKVPLEHGVWRPISILIPWEMRGQDMFDVHLATPDVWFPIEEIESSDERGLGVLVRDDPDEPGGGDDLRWAALVALPPPDSNELAPFEELVASRCDLAPASNSGRFNFNLTDSPPGSKIDNYPFGPTTPLGLEI